MNIPLKNAPVEDFLIRNYKINLFLKYTVAKNFLLKNLNLLNLN